MGIHKGSEARDRVRVNWERIEDIIRNLIIQGQQSGELQETLTPINWHFFERMPYSDLA